VVDIEADTAAGLSLILFFHLAKVLKDLPMEEGLVSPIGLSSKGALRLVRGR
jgi:hypothetical protein